VEFVLGSDLDLNRVMNQEVVPAGVQRRVTFSAVYGPLVQFLSHSYLRIVRVAADLNEKISCLQPQPQPEIRLATQ
jgi:hypothetical protein